MFDPFFNAIAWLLAWFYELPLVGGSYFWAITLLTLTIMLIVTPLNVKATRSMMTMSAMAPEMKKIQQEFADDRQRMNEELLAFYRENKINPLGGCLPMLLQIPFFIILYQVIYGLTRGASADQAAELGIEQGTFAPKYLDQFPDSELYNALLGSSDMPSVGMDLSRSAAAALQDSFGSGLPYMVLILVVAGSAFLQQKQMSVRNPNVEMPPQQKILLRVLPIFFAFISFNFAAGLVIYFFVSNIYRIFQNAAISMRLYNISGVQALLGIGATNLATAGGDGAIDTTGRERSGKDAPDTKGSGPAKGTGSATGGRSTGKGSSGSSKSGRDKASGGNAKSKGKPASGPGESNGKPGANGSGRTTPKGGTPSRSTPARRKKKRS